MSFWSPAPNQYATNTANQSLRRMPEYCDFFPNKQATTFQIINTLSKLSQAFAVKSIEWRRAVKQFAGPIAGSKRGCSSYFVGSHFLSITSSVTLDRLCERISEVWGRVVSQVSVVSVMFPMSSLQLFTLGLIWPNGNANNFSLCVLKVCLFYLRRNKYRASCCASCSEFQIRDQSHRNTLGSSICPDQVPCPVSAFSSPRRSPLWQLSLFHHMGK